MEAHRGTRSKRSKASSAQVTAVHSFDNSVVLGEHCQGIIMAARAVGVLICVLGLVSRDQGRQRWWPEPVVCTQSALVGGGHLQLPV